MSTYKHHKYGLSGKFTAIDGKADELESILLEAAERVSTANGCRLYLISREPNQINDVWVTEVWDTKEDHDNSLHAKGVKELISKAIPLLADQPKQGKILSVSGGFCIPEH